MKTEFNQKTSGRLYQQCLNRQPLHLKERIGLHSGSSFEEIIIEKQLFVDKTLFIKDVIDSDFSAAIIVRPRRWGKSLNMDMLRRFLSIETDSSGSVKDPPSSRKLFYGGEIQIEERIVELSPLSIALLEDSQIYQGHQGQYPVINLNWAGLKLIMFSSKYNQQYLEEGKIQFLDGFKIMLGKEYEKFYYLLKSGDLIQNDEELFNRILNKQCDNVKQLEKSIQFLSKLLYKFHNRKVFILIDEYDAPIADLFCQEIIEKDPQMKSFISKLRLQIADFIARVLQVSTKSNAYLEKGILTGVWRSITANSSGSGMNNIDIYDVDAPGFGGSYGFTEKEVRDQLVSKMLVRKKYGSDDEYQSAIDSLMRAIEVWYNGYHCPFTKDKVYNAFSVIWYLKSCKGPNKIVEGESFWQQSGSNNLFRLFLEQLIRQEKFPELLKLFCKQITVPLEIDSRVNMGEIVSCDQLNKQKFAYLSLNFGFLTGQIKQSSLSARIPNVESMRSYKKLIEDQIKQNKNLRDYLPRPEIQKQESVKKAIEKVFEAINYNCNASTLSSTLANIFDLTTTSTHILRSTDSLGFPKIDHWFLPITGESRTVIIHEYKVTQDPAQIQSQGQAALQQIYINNYMANSAKQYSWFYADQFIVRAIVFYSGHQSRVEILERKHSLEQARKIIEFFDKWGGAENRKMPQKEKGQSANTTVQELFEDLKDQNKVKTIDQLIAKINDTLKKEKEEEASEYSDSADGSEPSELSSMKKRLSSFRSSSNPKPLNHREVMKQLKNYNLQYNETGVVTRSKAIKQYRWNNFQNFFRTSEDLESATLDDIRSIPGFDDSSAESFFVYISQIKQNPKFRYK